MKRMYSAGLLSAAFLISILLVNCSKTTNSSGKQQLQPFIEDIAVLNFSPGLSATKRSVSPEHLLTGSESNNRVANFAALRSAGCGGFFNGSWGGSGYHKYATDTIRLDSVAQGKTIKVLVSSYDVPNRFTVYDASTGNIVASSSWMGYTSFSGPWGMSLNTPQNGTLTFTRGTSGTYLFVVETVVNGTSDSYVASIVCI